MKSACTAREGGGSLYITEMEAGSAIESSYPVDREVGCTVCGIPAIGLRGNSYVVNTKNEISVYTRWGHQSCGNSRLIYTGFIAGSHFGASGGGANSVCLTTSGATAPSGYSDGNENGNALFGTEYENTGTLDINENGDAACAVCEYTKEHREVYTQWGRQSCSNGHDLVYKGLVMSNHHAHQRSMHLCVDWQRQVHQLSSIHNHDGNLLYTTEMERSADEHAYARDVEVGCAVCGASVRRSVFTRWGSQKCPTRSSVLYAGFMASSRDNHPGGGSNTLCMHPKGETPDGADAQNKNGNLLYSIEYNDTGAIDENHHKDAACVVCQLDRWESVYTQ